MEGHNKCGVILLSSWMSIGVGDFSVLSTGVGLWFWGCRPLCCNSHLVYILNAPLGVGPYSAYFIHYTFVYILGAVVLLTLLLWVWGVSCLYYPDLVLVGNLCPIGSSFPPIIPSWIAGFLSHHSLMDCCAFAFREPLLSGGSSLALGFWACRGGTSCRQAGLDSILLSLIVLLPWWFLLLSDLDGLQ